MQVQVIRKPLKYAGRYFKIGESVAMTRKHAQLFIALGRARLPAREVTSPGYERTDMRAEATDADVRLIDKPSEGDKPKRRYRRRDMQAKP